MGSVCFTGHREIPEYDLEELKVNLYDKIIRLAKEGCVDFYTGGASGFDTLAAHAVLHVRDTCFPDIRLHIILPYRNKRIDARSRQADTITAVSEEYYNGCMFKRDRALVDAADICVCYLRKQKGGTKYTVSYANERGLEIIEL